MSSNRRVLDYAGAARAVAPRRLLVGSLIVYFMALAVAPVVSSIQPNAVGIFYWFLVAGGAILGLSISRPTSPLLGAASGADLLRGARRTTYLGTIGVLLLFFERYGIRGAPLEWDFFAVRAALEDTATGFIGTTAGFLAAFAPLGVMMGLLAGAHGARVPWRLHLLAGLVLLAYVAASLATGGRSVLLVIVLIHVLAMIYLRRLSGRTVNAVVVGGVLLAFCGLALASASMMLERLAQTGLDPMFSIESSGYAEWLQPAPSALATMQSNSEWTPLLGSFFSLAQYVFHGFFEFNVLYTDFTSRHTLGGFTLWLPIKIISLIIGTNMNVDPDLLVGWRSGIFTTFIGPIYVDFGWAAPPLIAALFWALSWPARRLALGDVRFFPAASVVGCVVILFPVVNLLLSASGTYPFVAALTIPLLAKPRREANKNAC